MRKLMENKFIRRFTALALVCALAVSAYSLVPRKENKAPGESAERPLKIRTFTARRENRDFFVRFIGTAEALATASVSSSVQGICDSVHAENGSEVKKGGILARLNTAEYRMALESARCEAEAAESSLRLSREKLSLAERAALQRFREMEKASMLAGEKLERFQYMSGIMNDSRSLYESGGMSLSDFESVEADCRSAWHRYGEALKTQEIANEAVVSPPWDPDDASRKKWENELKKNNTAAEQAEVQSALSLYRKFSNEASRLEALIRRCEIRAPISGLIASRKIEPGEEAAQGRELFSIIDPEVIIVKTHISENDSSKICKGAKAEFNADACPGASFSGTVRRISPALDPATRTLETGIEFVNGGRFIKAGMFIRGRIITGTSAGVIMLPTESVFEKDGRTCVWIISDGSALRKEVECGRTLYSEVEIIRGIPDNGTVAINALSLLRDGMKVEEER